MSFNIVDVFHDDIFTVRSMMDFIDRQPYVPEMISKWLPWNSAGELSNLVAIEFRDGNLSLTPEAERGAPGYRPDDNVREALPLKIPHYPLQKTLKAESVRGVRAFGSELVEVFEEKRNEILTEFNVRNRLVWENSRAGAITGKLFKSDGTTLSRNWFDTLGITQSTRAIAFSNGNTEVLEELIDAKEQSEDALGDLVASGYMLIAGRNMLISTEN